MTVPGTHRTPPDEHGDYVEVSGRVIYVVSPSDGEHGAVVHEDALPALVAALAAHLTVDARRVLTRDLAAQDDGVLDLHARLDGPYPGGDYCAEDGDPWPCPTARSLAVAARPTPTPEEAHRG